MRKFLILALISAAIIYLTACNNTPDTSKTMDETNELLLLSTLDGTVSFITEKGTKLTITDYKIGNAENINVIPSKYTFVDLDQDGTKELIVYVSPDYGAYIIFRYNNGEIYSYSFTARSLIALREDGSFVQSSGASNNRFAHFSFNNNKYSIICDAEENASESTYQIAGSDVTKELFDSFAEGWYNKSEAIWTTIL